MAVKKTTAEVLDDVERAITQARRILASHSDVTGVLLDEAREWLRSADQGVMWLQNGRS